MGRELSPEELIARARRFFKRYGDELESVSSLLKIRLQQLAIAYTLENSIPRESINVISRVKTLESFLKKLEKKYWPQFYYPSKVATDLIGARVICWFLDDVYGMLGYIKDSKHFEIIEDSIEDYIKTPKVTGYRSIHVLSDISYDRVKLIHGTRKVVDDRLVCEIQLRTKLQDAWGDFTHEVHYKVLGGFAEEYETLVAEISNRLASEDRSALAIRNILQDQVSDKNHEGLTDD